MKEVACVISYFDVTVNQQQLFELVVVYESPSGENFMVLGKKANVIVYPLIFVPVLPSRLCSEIQMSNHRLSTDIKTNSIVVYPLFTYFTIPRDGDVVLLRSIGPARRLGRWIFVSGWLIVEGRCQGPINSWALWSEVKKSWLYHAWLCWDKPRTVSRCSLGVAFAIIPFYVYQWSCEIPAKSLLSSRCNFQLATLSKNGTRVDSNWPFSVTNGSRCCESGPLESGGTPTGSRSDLRSCIHASCPGWALSLTLSTVSAENLWCRRDRWWLSPTWLSQWSWKLSWGQSSGIFNLYVMGCELSQAQREYHWVWRERPATQHPASCIPTPHRRSWWCSERGVG
jgi:hypothetical protein